MSKRLITPLLLLACINFSFANVQIQINDTTYVYDANPRLAEVLAPVVRNDKWYWPSAQLFNLDKSIVETKRQELIQLLSHDKTASRNVLIGHQALINQIETWQLADRISIKIDFELARFSLSHNPRFESGNYRLTLSGRPKQLYIFGAVVAPSHLAYTDNKCLKDILVDIARLKSADLNQVYIISPEGEIKIAPIAYWNHRCVVPMPGSSIYIPLQENQWFKKASLVNQKMTSLALNRIHAQ